MRSTVDYDRSNKLTIWGILLLIGGVFLGGLCLYTLIDTMAKGNNLGFAFMIIFLMLYGIPGLILSFISVILNFLAYRSALEDAKQFKISVLIASIVSVLISLSSFVIWFIGA